MEYILFYSSAIMTKKIEFEPEMFEELPDIIWTGAHRFLHCCKTQDLQQMILHYITNDSKLIKVSTASLSAEGLLEGDGYTCNAVSIPCGSKYHVPKTQANKILNHFLAQVVINSVELLLCEQLLQMIAQVSRTLRVFAKRLLNYHPCPSCWRHAGCLKCKITMTYIKKSIGFHFKR